MPVRSAGVTLIGGEPAELVDAHWLFASISARGRHAPQTSLVCRLPADDPWMQNMLRPIVEAAGYLVVGEGDELLRRRGDRVAAAARLTTARPSARPDRSRDEPDGADGDGSIYRYDRAGLLIALKAASAGRGR